MLQLIEGLKENLRESLVPNTQELQQYGHYGVPALMYVAGRVIGDLCKFPDSEEDPSDDFWVHIPKDLQSSLSFTSELQASFIAGATGLVLNMFTGYPPHLEMYATGIVSSLIARLREGYEERKEMKWLENLLAGKYDDPNVPNS